MSQNQPPRRPIVLHLAANYPDGISPGPKTTAVKHLLDYADGIDHVVVSLTRVLQPWREKTLWQGDTLVVQYFALPRALLHERFMRRLAGRVDRALAMRPKTYDVVHAHKVSMEGFVAEQLVAARGLPRVYSVRPYTDLRVFALSARLRATGRRLLQDAASVVVLAPWARQALARLLEAPLQAPTATIPNAVVHAPQPTSIGTAATQPRFVSVFRANQYKAKGFVAALSALKTLRAEYADIGMDVYGAGDWSSLKAQIEREGLADRVRFCGPLSHEALMQRFSDYLGLVMPSRRETFGMVFAEALCSGIPVVFAGDAGIDGFFEAQRIGAVVPADDVEALAAAMRRLVDENDALRQTIRAMREAGELDIFLPASIKARYESLIHSLLPA